MENSVSFFESNNNDCSIERDGVDQRAMLVVDPQLSAPSVGQSSLAVLRPGSDDGLQSGNMNMVGDYSTTNKEFYVEALSGERLAIRRAIVHIYVTDKEVEPGTYGNIDSLANGIALIYERSGVILSVLDGLPIQKQEDWGRIGYDARPVGPYGATSKTPFFQVRISFSKFAGDRGIILEEGDRLGFRLSDDFTDGGADPLEEHYVYFEGEHLGTPNAAWQNVLSPI